MFERHVTKLLFFGLKLSQISTCTTTVIPRYVIQQRLIHDTFYCIRMDFDDLTLFCFFMTIHFYIPRYEDRWFVSHQICAAVWLKSSCHTLFSNAFSALHCVNGMGQLGHISCIVYGNLFNLTNV